MRAGKRTRIAIWMWVVSALAAAGCGGASSPTASGSNTATTNGTTGSTTTGTTGGSGAGCGVTLADVKGVLPANTPVAQNRTPDSRRCNFTWAQNGNWGIDVAFKAGGRAQLEASSEAPADGSKLRSGKPYEVVSGVGTKAWASGDSRRVGLAVIRGNDFLIVGIDYDGAPPAGAKTATGMNADFLRICTQLARKGLGRV